MIILNIEDYLKLKKNNNQDKLVKYTKNLLTRILLSIIIVLITCIYIKIDNNNSLNVKNYLFNDNLKFTKINNLYKNYFGNILPTVDTDTDLVFNSDSIKTKEYSNYENGVKILTNKNETVSTICGGIVVFIGEKENYENTVIIQGNDGIDYWYGGITNIAVNLYDYIEKDTLIGETKNDYLYIVLHKDGKYLNYEDII